MKAEAQVKTAQLARSRARRGNRGRPRRIQAAGFDSIYLYTHEMMAEKLALYARIGYVEYDRRLHGDACLVYLRKQLG